MASANINRVIITGNLTADPELRRLPSGNSVCRLRVASNTRRRSGDDWVDKPNYFDVIVWGAQGETVARFLTKGSGVAVDGRLDWREWQTQDGQKRQAVEIIAEHVQFIGGTRQSGRDRDAAHASTEPDVAGGGDDDEIPF